MAMASEKMDEDVEFVCAVSCSTAMKLHQNRKTLNVKSLNILGNIEAVSEIIRIKKDIIFMVKMSISSALEESVKILVKRPEHIQWNSHIVPQNEYVFTNLIPTSLHKGDARETQIFTTSADSSFYPTENIVCNVVPLNEWLKIHNHSIEKKGVLSTNANSQSRHHSMTPNFVSYEGIITNTDLKEAGVFELDKKIRLYVSHIPAVHRFRFLEVGTQITVYNAHHITCAEEPKMRLCCCGVGCVRAETTESRANELDKVDESYIPTVFERLVYNYNLCVSHLDQLLKDMQSLRAKFCPLIVSECMLSCNGGLLECLYTLKSRLGGNSYLNPSENNSRSIVLEFFRDNHDHCHILDQKKRESHCMPSIKDILVKAEEIVWENSRLENNISEGYSNAKLNDLLYWQSQEVLASDWKSNPILVCVVKGSKRTGHLQLVDQTGRVNAIMLPDETPEDVAVKSCNPQSMAATDAAYHAANVDRSLPFGTLVRIEGFSVICERFQSSNYPSIEHIGNEAFIQHKRTVCYVIFTWQNVTILDKPKSLLFNFLQPDVGTKEGVDIDINMQCSQETGDGTTRCGATQKTAVCQLVYVIEKEHPRVRERINSSAKLSFFVQVLYLDKPKLHSMSGDQVVFEENQCNFNDITDKQHKVNIFFQGSAVQYHGLLQVGQAYQLVMKDSSNVRVFSPKYHSSVVRKAMEKLDAERQLTLPSSTCIVHWPMHRVSREVVEKHVIPTMSITQLHDQRFSDSPSLVSTEGIVIESSFCPSEDGTKSKAYLKLLQEENDNLEVSTPGNRHLRLTLAEPATGTTISVYLRLDNLRYPLGLLPGFKVSMFKLERKVSKKGDMYLQFVPTSNYVIVGRGEYVHHKKYDILDPESFDGETLRLGQLLTLEDHNKYFRLRCHVLQVLRVSLAESPAGGVTARASALVEDGSGSALLYLRAGATVAVLLGLGGASWSELEEIVRRSPGGTVDMHMKSPEGGGMVERYLAELCDSPTVKRPICVYGKRFRTFYGSNGKSHSTTMSMEIDDFPLKQVELGGKTLETHSLPLLRVSCSHIEEVNFKKLVLQDL